MLTSTSSPGQIDSMMAKHLSHIIGITCISWEQCAGTVFVKDFFFYLLQGIQRMPAVEKYMKMISGKCKCAGSADPAGCTGDQYIFLVHNILHFQKENSCKMLLLQLSIL